MYNNKDVGVFLSKYTLKKNGFEAIGYHGNLMYERAGLNNNHVDLVIAKPSKLEDSFNGESEAYLKVLRLENMALNNDNEVKIGLRNGVQLSLDDEYLAKMKENSL